VSILLLTVQPFSFTMLQILIVMERNLSVSLAFVITHEF